MKAELGPSVVTCSALLLACLVAACAGDTKPGTMTGSAGTAGNNAASSAGESGIDEPTSDSAQWPMPNSAGLDLPNPASYDASSTPGVVHDLITGLDWLQDPGIELYPRADAIAHCADLTFAGFDDWRVPEFIELVTLFDVVPNVADPLDPIYISPTFKAEGRFWSMTAVSSGLGRLLDFTAAGCGMSPVCSIGVAGNADAALGGAFCVRGGQAPATSPRYMISDTQVTDLRTGLTWFTVPVNAQTGAYADALGACDALGNGARLPSITELLSILLPILDKTAFPDWPKTAFAWSSSPVPAKGPEYYWVGAIGGATNADVPEDSNRIECVR